MSQYIGIQIQDENGKLISKSSLNFAIVCKAIWQLTGCKEKYPWLVCVNPYGDTTFNELQIPNLIKELQELLMVISDNEVKDIIIQLIKFAKLDIHEYLKFIGD